MGVTWGVPIPREACVKGMNERCLEIPLGLELMQLSQPGWILDAGCAMNQQLPHGGAASVVHLTQDIESERACLSDGKRSYVCGDLRDLRLYASRAFDRTVCISTLEHVGFDNTNYKGPAEDDPESVMSAVRELCRVTDRRLLITVPFHPQDARSTQWRYFTRADIGMMVGAIGACGFATEVRFYGHCIKGWYGGELTPVEVSDEGFPQSVNAIVALRCVRE